MSRAPMKYDYPPTRPISDVPRSRCLLRQLTEVSPMAIEIREPGLQLSVVEPSQAPPTVATAAPTSPGRQAGGLPSDFLVGTLHHPLLRLRHPVRLAVAQDGEFVTVTLDE